MDAVIPVWAYMLLSSALQPFAKNIYIGPAEEMHRFLFLKNIEAFDPSGMEDQRIVIKGCGDKKVEASAYAAITQKLRPVVKSIMYGEPCSTVPVFKKKP